MAFCEYSILNYAKVLDDHAQTIKDVTLANHIVSCHVT